MSKSYAAEEDVTLEILRAQARRSVAHQRKRRARAFAEPPMRLENLCSGLAAAPPTTLITIAKHLLGTERYAPLVRLWRGSESHQRQGCAALWPRSAAGAAPAPH